MLIEFISHTINHLVLARLIYYLDLGLKHMFEGRVRYGPHGGEIPLVYLIRGDSIICGGLAGISLGVLRSVV
jgi:hypothetical protein